VATVGEVSAMSLDDIDYWAERLRLRAEKKPNKRPV